ncbi:very short patch repair endonuclease [Marispirochaeta sp.]|uniref:very short patch repair endonuclease n=1 Tax=Marispirochaeta sp. TaxID=2038653 RepID=UPI0029C78A02|nr:very short patch repair endonuclease [Marispirochaeta sp.]
MDVHSPEQRSYNMSKIKAKDTRPEMIVRRWLWANGYRYRLHSKDLPGKPDIVLPKYHAIIFVHGCFWHRHGCRFTSNPSTRNDFWQAKFKKTMERDRYNIERLNELGWKTEIIWECEINNWNETLENRIVGFLETSSYLLYSGGGAKEF